MYKAHRVIRVSVSINVHMSVVKDFFISVFKLRFSNWTKTGWSIRSVQIYLHGDVMTAIVKNDFLFASRTTCQVKLKFCMEHQVGTD